MTSSAAFADLLGWDLSIVADSAAAAKKRAIAAEQYSAVVKNAPALREWTGSASDQARALAASLAAHSDAIVAQSRALESHLRDYAARGGALKAAAMNLADEAAVHGYRIGPNGSVAAAAPHKGLYARAIARQLADKTSDLLDRDQQNHQDLARAINAVLNPGSGKAGAGASSDYAPIPISTSPVKDVTFTEKDLYGASGMPSLDDVHQKSVGDCWFDAAMAAVANTEPDVIKHAISYDPKTQSFDVSLYNYPQEYQPWYGRDETAPKGKLQTINISQDELKTDVDLPGASDAVHIAPDGSVVYNPKAPIWPAVMEAAYAKQQYGSVADGLGIAHYDPSTGAQGGIAGGWGPAGLMAVTGHSGVDISAHAITYDQLHTAIDSGRPVVMSTTGQGRDDEFKDGLAHSHEYTVTGVSKAANGDTLVTARNPWGDSEVHIGPNGQRFDPVVPAPGFPEGQDPTTGYITFDLDQVNKDRMIGDFVLGDGGGRPAK